jgi:amino acid adenylation domain-containing protein
MSIDGRDFDPMSEILHSYDLSPMQAGMLFHSLYHERTGIYVQQMVATLDHDLDAGMLLQAWSRVVERHALFRTSFHWGGEGKPEQRVHRAATVACLQEDWQALTETEQARRLAAYLEDDRVRGFDPELPPLMRLALFNLGGNRHQLVWTSHHALLDGRSRVLVLKELFAIYDSLAEGKALALDEPQPFHEYVDWLKGQDMAQAEAFWRDLLKDFDSPTPLPGANVSGRLNTRGRHAEKTFHLSEALTDRLTALARQEGYTLNTVLQGAWALLLSAYSNQDDVVFGATRACRHSALEGANAMIGLFINTVPVRVKIRPEATLTGWLKELRRQHVAVRAFEHTPLVSIAGWSGMTGGTRLFDSIVVFENHSLDAAMKAQRGEWEKRTFDLLQRSNYPITLAAYLDHGLSIKLEYDAERFAEPVILRLGKALKRTLAAILEDPQARIGDLKLFGPAERHQLLVEGNDTAAAYASARLIHELIEEQAREQADAVAVVCEGESVSYGEMNRRANRLANYLIERGAGPEAVVGLCLERGVEMVVSWLAVLKSGAAYLPLDPSYPDQRLSYMLASAGANLLIAGAETLPQGIRQLDPKAEARQISRQNAANPVRRATPQNLAYVIYTSGSTGSPKGAMICHGSVVNLLNALKAGLYTNAPQRRLRISLNGPVSFDTSVKQLVQLASGHTLHVVSQAVREDPEALMKFISEVALDVFDCTPSLLQSLIDCGLFSQARLPSVALLGGEAIDDRLWRMLAAARTTRFYNVYGPTETTVNATACHIAADVGSPVIGRPLANMAVYLLNEHLQPVGKGAVGELFIAGAGVGRGYIGSAVQTAERFLPDPYRDAAGERMYRTGDLCRYAEDGRIEYLGRSDQQIKIRGYRVEPGEVEAALGRQRGVRQAAVVSKEGPAGGPHLVGYVVAETGVTDREIRESVRGELPEYMMPQAVVVIPEMPLTANGKLDRRRLKSLPDVEPGPAATEPERAQTAVEEIIAAIWKDVLKRSSVGLRQNFFDLGGHSLLATQVIVRVRKAFNLEIELRRLFEQATVEGLAQAVEQMLSRGTAACLSPIRKVPRLVAAAAQAHKKYEENF